MDVLMSETAIVITEKKEKESLFAIGISLNPEFSVAVKISLHDKTKGSTSQISVAILKI